jgi:MarR family transcriptional regulator, organic hydroperoxide resistance regulator
VDEKKGTQPLGFMLANICHLHHSLAHQLLEEVGLYRGQPPVLHALWEQEGLTQTELAERMRITPATLSKMLRRMEKTGFIERRVDALDQRISRVYLTDSGREVKGRLQAVWKQMDEDTFGGFSPEERARLECFLTKMRDNLLQATGEEPWK